MLTANDLLGLSHLFKLAIEKAPRPIPGNAFVLVPVDDLQTISEILLAESIRRRERETTS